MIARTLVRNTHKDLSAPQPASSSGSLLGPSLIAIGLALLTITVYARSLGFGFVDLDDPEFVSLNPHVKAGLTPAGLLWALTSLEVHWHPLTRLSWMLDARLGGMDPRVFHLTNLVLHVANTILLYLVLERMTRACARSAFVAALFAVHPLHVESVAWITERRDVLSTLFWLLTMLAYTAYSERPGAARYGLVLAAFGAGLMAKSMLVTLPLVLLILDCWPLARLRSEASLREGSLEEASSGSRSGRGEREKGTRAVRDGSAQAGGTARAEAGGIGQRGGIARPEAGGRGRVGVLAATPVRFLEKAPLLALSAVAAALTLAAQKASGALVPGQNLSLGARVANALVAYASYLGMMVWPANLGCLYPLPAAGVPAWKVAGSAILLVSLTVFAFRSARRRPYLLAGWLWYLTTLVPVIGIVQSGAQALADRYTYVPLIGLFIIVSWGAVDLATHATRMWRGPSEIGHEQWVRGQSGEAGLERDARRAAGEQALERDGRAGVEEGGPGRRERLGLFTSAAIVCAVLSVASFVQIGYWRDSTSLFAQSVRATPESPIAHNMLGAELKQAGRVRESIAQFRDAVRLDPDYADAACNLAGALVKAGENEEGARIARGALERWPGLAVAHAHLGLALVRQAQLEEAQVRAPAVPSVPSAHARGNQSPEAARETLAHHAGRLKEEGTSHLREAVRIGPNFPDARLNLGVALAERQDYDGAIIQFSEVLRLRPDDPDAQRFLDLARARKRERG